MLRCLLLVTSLLSVSSHTYHYPPPPHSPLLSLALQASFALNSTTLYLPPEYFQGHLSDGNLSISFLLDNATHCSFSLLFSRTASSWQLSAATVSYNLNGSAVREEMEPLLLQMGDSLPISLLHNHSYLCETPFSHAGSGYLTKVEVSYLQFEFNPPDSGFSEPQVCLIAYDQFWVQTIFAFSLALFLAIVVTVNGLYHNMIKCRKKLLHSASYSVVPTRVKQQSEQDN